MKLIKILILCLLLSGCANNEQIAACVQTCKSVNAKMDGWGSGFRAGIYHCICWRDFEINDDGTSIKEK